MQNRVKVYKAICLIILLSIMLAGCKRKYEELNLEMYDYRDTKELVKFVYDFKQKLEKEGIDIIERFKLEREQYLENSRYVYIYNLKGKNLFHAGMPELEGEDLLEIKDLNGKKVTKLVLAALKDENNPHAWVHYTWWEPGKFYPVTKSSCHFQVITSDNDTLFVGGGINYPQEEREFVRIVVDNAVDLIEKQGFPALKEINDPASEFSFREVKTFVFDQDGKVLVSPVADYEIRNFNLLESVDEIGHEPFKMAKKALENNSKTWVIFMAKNRFQRNLVKKILYLRKTKIDEK